MKISIFTFSKGDNYGAVLQAFALAQILRDWGHQVEFIHLTWFDSWRQRLASFLLPQSYRFENFRKKYLGAFSKPCHKKEDLSKAVQQADLCIVGSDQVWNPDITGKYALHYFFDFLPDKMPRIAYAASFGYDEWESHQLTTEACTCLKKFTAISVREESGVNICKNTFNVQATWVLDPTLLIRDYSSYIKIPKVPSRIVSFKFLPSPKYYQLLNFFSHELHKQVCLMGYIHRNLSKDILSFNIESLASVEKWIGNISNAELVVTDSFHCTVFSIIYRRQFIVIAGNKKRKGRIYSLLKELNLLDRFYETIDDVYLTNKWKQKIDYDSITPILDQKRRSSIEFLSNILSKINKNNNL